MHFVDEEDLARLTRIPGVGKKTAERIVIELRDRLPESAAMPADTSLAPGGALRDDVLSALVNLGYQRPSVEKTVDALLRKTAEPEFESLLREVLRDMSR